MYSKLLLTLSILFSLPLHAIDLTASERPTETALLTELNDQGQPLYGDIVYELTVNKRDGVTKHYTSFQLCTKPVTPTEATAGARCTVYWVVIPKEDLRCEGERFLGLADAGPDHRDDKPLWLELVILGQPNGVCGPVEEIQHPIAGPQRWRVRMMQEGTTDRFFEGTPARVLRILE